MRRKDPITLIGLAATLILIGMALFLYLPKFTRPQKPATAEKTVAPQTNIGQATSPPTPLPSQAPQAIQQSINKPVSEEEALQAELQRILDQVEKLEQENNRLAQEIDQTEQESQQLDVKIEQIRGQ